MLEKIISESDRRVEFLFDDLISRFMLTIFKKRITCAITNLWLVDNGSWVKAIKLILGVRSKHTPNVLIANTIKQKL